MTDSHGPRVPRASAQVMRSSIDEHRKQRHARGVRRTVIGAVLLGALVWGANTLFVARPVQATLRADTADARITLSARFRWRLDPSTLVLDLERYDAADPDGLLRALAEVSAAVGDAGRDFRLVLLTHGSDAAFAIGGDDWDRIAKIFKAGANPRAIALQIPPFFRDARPSAALRPWSRQLPALLGLRAVDAPLAAARWAAGGR